VMNAEWHVYHVTFTPADLLWWGMILTSIAGLTYQLLERR